MPCYEYLCPECDKITEAVKPFPGREGSPEWDSDFYQKLECEHCGATANKVVSGTHVQFKCGGFYETDYKWKK